MQATTETRVGIFVLAALGVFAYMGMQVGAFRLDRYKYNKYSMTFADVSGLSKKAEVKIAGVKIGWVEEVTLSMNGSVQATAAVMIDKDFKIYEDAYAIVRQDGFLGPKFVEIVPGTPLMRPLKSGEALEKPSVAPVSIDELLQKMGRIAASVEDITKSVSTAMAGNEGGGNMLKETMENIHGFTERLNKEFIPSLQENIDRMAGKIETTAGALEEASLQARDGLKSMSSVADKLDKGQGVLGKLINEDETYKDLRVAVSGLKNYFSKVDMIQIVVDSHFETMGRPAEHYKYEDTKGFFSVRIHPSQDHFYLLQLASSEKGYIERSELRRSWYDCHDQALKSCEQEDCTITTCQSEACSTKKELSFRDQLRFADTEKHTFIARNAFKIGAQVGKTFGDVSLRVGLFEGSAGVAVDFDIPFRTNNLRWVTSLEGYDFRGWNRIDDRRPHLKWINRVYIMKNIYTTFGADDFISKNNANVFAGFGVRFSDDDLKYLASSFGSSFMGGNTGRR